MDLSSITNKYSLNFGNKTDVGRVREGNEDYMASFQTKIGHIFIVCDGMGGHTSGEIASRLAVERLKEYLENNSESSKSTKQLLLESLENANQAIIDKTIESPEYKGMGTTCVILAIKSGVAYYANVGDSRIYIIRNGIIYQITKDQTFVQTLIDQGHINYDEAEIHPRKNELVQALGINERIVPEINEVALRIFKGDKFILCSDGLSGMINDNEIFGIVKANEPVTASNLLVSAANDKGGTDNITVQVISIIEGDILPVDMKNIPPVGALDKNTEIKFTKSITGNTTREISDYPINEKESKNNSKMILSLLALFILIIFISFYFLFFNKSVSDINIISHSESSNDSSNIENVNNETNGKIVNDFLSKIYLGNAENYPKVEEFENIEIDTIEYTDKNGNMTRISYNQLLKNIKDYELKFKKYSPADNILTLTVKSDNIRFYSIRYSADKNIVKIEAIKYKEEEKNDKEVRSAQNKSGNQNSKNNQPKQNQNNTVKENQNEQSEANSENDQREEIQEKSEKAPESKEKINNIEK